VFGFKVFAAAHVAQIYVTIIAAFVGFDVRVTLIIVMLAFGLLGQWG
jgi:hypothetical protein